MTQRTIVATIVVKEIFAQAFMPIVYGVVDETRNELGCLAYDLYQDIDNPLKYVILETWATQEAIEQHNNSAHFKRFIAAIEGNVASVDISVIRKSY